MSKNITYTTDVAHCMGCRCPIKDKCLRYWLFINSPKRYCAPYIVEQYDFEAEECEMFKPIE